MENLLNSTELDKKRNLRQVSQSSSTSSPLAKMPNIQESSLPSSDSLDPLDSSTANREGSINPLNNWAFLELTDSVDSSDTSLHNKMDTIIGMLKTLTTAFYSHKEDTKHEIEGLQEENRKLKLSVKQMEGNAMRMDSEIDRLKAKCEDLQLRSMSHNILIHNVQEERGENVYKVVCNILLNSLNIPEQLLNSEEHPAAAVLIDVAHRIGKPGWRPRPIVVKFALQRGKETIFRYIKNLKGQRISISEQLPGEMRERRDIMFPNMRRLREEHQGDGMKVHLSRDKLTINNTPVPSPFRVNLLSDVLPGEQTPLPYDTLLHTEVVEYSRSYFQGHVMQVKSIQEAKAAHAALFQEPSVAKAHHVMYAYCVPGKSPNDCIFGNDDDGEYGASEMLLETLKKHGLTECFVAVSRIHSGPNIGKKRFQLIESCAKLAIDKL